MSSLVLTRRQALRAAVVAAGVAATGSTSLVATADPATARTVLEGPDSAANPSADAILLRGLPVHFGTPTDLAAMATETVWALDADGIVQRFDREQDHWVTETGREWGVVLTYGTVMLARWGRPSGRNWMVLVYSSAPEPPPATSTEPAVPTTPTALTDPTTLPSPTTGGSTTTSVAGGAPVPTSRTPTYGPLPDDPGGAPPGPASGELSYTGINLGRLGLIGASLLGGGAALLALRRRRMSTAPGAEDNPPQENHRSPKNDQMS